MLDEINIIIFIVFLCWINIKLLKKIFWCIGCKINKYLIIYIYLLNYSFISWNKYLLIYIYLFIKLFTDWKGYTV